MTDKDSEEFDGSAITPFDTLKELLTEIEGKFRQKDEEKKGEPFKLLLSSWQLSPYTYADLANKVEDFKKYLETHEYQQSVDFSQTLGYVVEIIGYLNDKVLGHFSTNIAENISAVRVLDQTISLSLRLIKPYEKGLTDYALQQKVASVKQKLEATEKRLDAAGASLEDVEVRVERIIRADDAASKLPLTLDELDKANNKIQTIRQASEHAKDEIDSCEDRIKNVDEYASKARQRIESISVRCDEILMKATGVGLAASFTKRSKDLNRVTLAWAVTLIAALVAVVFSAYWRSSEILALMQSSEKAGSLAVFTNYAISILAIGAPIWLAWLATKQIGYSFRLSEDYAFKASISQAYEGFRREAHNQGSDLERKILESIVTMFDQEPLRYVASSVHGSPVHEIFCEYLLGKFNKGAKNRVEEVEKPVRADEDKAPGGEG